MTHYSLLATFGVRLTTYHCSLLTRLECAAAPGSGGCAAMFTASSMAFAIEAMGMALPGSASHPAMTRADPRSVPEAKVRSP